MLCFLPTPSVYLFNYFQNMHFTDAKDENVTSFSRHSLSYEVYFQKQAIERETLNSYN